MVVKRPAHGWEGEFAPGDLVPGEKSDLKAFGARRRLVGKARPEENLDLADAGYGVHPEQRFYLEIGACFLAGLAPCAFLDALAKLHEPGRKRPETPAGFNRPAAEEDTRVTVGKNACDNARVGVIDEPAALADTPFPVLARGDLMDKGDGDFCLAHGFTITLCCEVSKAGAGFCFKGAERRRQAGLCWRGGQGAGTGVIMAVGMNGPRRTTGRASLRRGERFRLSESPSHLLRRAEQVASDIFQQAERPVGVTLRQTVLLAAIAEAEGASQADLVNATGVDRSTLGEMMSRMERKGLIARVSARADARAKSVKLTAEGRRRLEAALPAIRAVDRALLAALPESSQAAFTARLSALVRSARPGEEPDGPLQEGAKQEGRGRVRSQRRPARART